MKYFIEGGLDSNTYKVKVECDGTLLCLKAGTLQRYLTSIGERRLPATARPGGNNNNEFYRPLVVKVL